MTAAPDVESTAARQPLLPSTLESSLPFIRNCSGLRGAEGLMAEYGGWVTLGDESPKPPEKSGSWLKPIYLTKSGQLPSFPFTLSLSKGRPLVV